MEKRARQRSSRASVRRAPWRGFDFSSEATGAVDSHPSLRIGRRIEAVAGGPIWAVRGRPSFPLRCHRRAPSLGFPLHLEGAPQVPILPFVAPIEGTWAPICERPHIELDHHQLAPRQPDWSHPIRVSNFRFRLPNRSFNLLCFFLSLSSRFVGSH